MDHGEISNDKVVGQDESPCVSHLAVFFLLVVDPSRAGRQSREIPESPMDVASNLGTP